MSNERNDLGEALRRRAEQARLTPAGLGEVQHRARRIRRRRTSLAVAGAAATVAVIAGLGVAFLPGGGDDSTPVVPSTPGPEPLRTQAPRGTPAPAHTMSHGPNRSLGAGPAKADTSGPASTGRLFRVDVTPQNAGQTFGGEPGVPMWQDGTIIAANGTPTQVGERVRRFVQTAPGVWSGLIEDPSTGGWDWTTYRAGGGTQPTFRAPSADSAAVTPDGGSVAWMWWPQDTNRTADTPSSWTLSLSGPHQRQWQVGTGDLSVAGILSDGDVVYNDGSTAKVARQDGRLVDLGPFHAASVSTGTGDIAVQRSDGCTAIVDESGATRTEACGYGPVQFSADGSLLLARPLEGGAARADELTILRAGDLSPIATFRAPAGGRFDDSPAWSGSSVVVPVYGEGQWALAWLSQDGVTIGRSSGRPGSASAPPYAFGAGPLTAAH